MVIDFDDLYRALIELKAWREFAGEKGKCDFSYPKQDISDFRLRSNIRLLSKLAEIDLKGVL